MLSTWSLLLSLPLILASSYHQNLMISKDYDCAIRELAYEYAQYIRPDLKNYRSIFDGLELDTICGQTPPSPVETLQDRMERVASQMTPDQFPTNTIFVSTTGSDSNPGTQSQPVASLYAAVLLTRSKRDNGRNWYIVMRGGTYEMKDTLRLNAGDSGLVITSAFGELVTISGGRTLTNLTWAPYNGSITGIFMTQLPSGIDISSDALNQMWINAKRQIRARYPNADPEVTGLYTPQNTGYISSAKSWVAPKTYPPAEEIHVAQPARENSYFPTYQMGIGGPVSPFTPPKSFWGLAHPPGGAGSTYQVPSGVTYKSNDFSPHVMNWTRPEKGIVHAFHQWHWGNWMFTIDSVDTTKDTIYFGRGGIQEARGNWAGGEFYVENIFEELDYPAEWYVDDQTGILYYYANSTDQSPPSEITISQIPYLISMEGTPDAPVHDIRLTGLTFAYTSQTFMKEYAVPSGGDWSIHLGAAIMTHGVDHIQIDTNFFHGIGGNTILIHGYARNTVIRNNEILLSGDSGIALIGEFDGIDATDGTQPLDTVIANNLIHELGIWVKQVSPVIQAVSSQTAIIGNIFFNMPRAGINFNDGFGGGSLVQNNLIFNTVRETADHGPFNSWDRFPLIMNITGKLTLIPEPNYIVQNFLINNYHAVWPIDHDDGSSFYIDQYNVMAYGGFKNYFGHNRSICHNVYLFPDTKFTSKLATSPKAQANVGLPWGSYCAQTTTPRLHESGYGDVYQKNNCTLSLSNIIYEWDDTQIDPKTGLQNLVPNSNYNQFWMDPSVGVPQVNIGGKLMNLTTYQTTLNFDHQSRVFGMASVQQVIAWSKHLLWQTLHINNVDPTCQA